MSARTNDESTLDYEDAAAVGYKIVEMADRVRKVAPITPGVTATWILEIDGKSFEVTVKVAS